ncbi:MAG: amidohydrolase [Christensenellales bacterium]|nr:amidohydrolase [Christensenellales bacterium]
MTTLEMLRPFEAQMTADRRWLHEHPELSGCETETLGYIVKALEALHLGIHIVPGGGVIGVLGEGEPCVLLRADCDALPIQESPTNLTFPRCCVSQNPGVMHACGHDAHMAMLLGAARALAAHREEIPGCVLFVFERGEEKGGKGYLEHLLPYIEEKFAVGACYATHVRWDIPSGKIAVLDGAAMAGAFGFDVTLHGRGGHGSRPDLAVSPIDCFAAIHAQLLALRMRAAAPEQVLTYSLGLVQAGEQGNTIPETLRFAGTVRTFDTAGAGERFAKETRRIIDGTCEAQGCTAEYKHFSKPLYEVRNHPEAAARAKQAIARNVGMLALTAASPWMASESMSAYLKLWPGVLTFTGIRNEKVGAGANHHTPQFDLDESALLPGAAAACAFALDYLRERPAYAFERDIVSMQDLVSRSI